MSFEPGGWEQPITSSPTSKAQGQHSQSLNSFWSRQVLIYTHCAPGQTQGQAAAPAKWLPTRAVHQMPRCSDRGKLQGTMRAGRPSACLCIHVAPTRRLVGANRQGGADDPRELRASTGGMMRGQMGNMGGMGDEGAGMMPGPTWA